VYQLGWYSTGLVFDRTIALLRGSVAGEVVEDPVCFSRIDRALVVAMLWVGPLHPGSDQQPVRDGRLFLL
jgi:hypothetical protein